MTRPTGVRARPARLEDFATTTGAIQEAVADRAGWLADAWDAYARTNDVDWRVDFGALAELLAGWGTALDDVGAWTARFATALREEDGGNFHGLMFADQASLHGGLSAEDRAVISETDREEPLDWGDADDPPEWLEHARDVEVRTNTVNTAIDVVMANFANGRGGALQWIDRTPLGFPRWASPATVARVGEGMTVGGAALSGVIASIDQWRRDDGSYTVTGNEQVVRAAARGAGVAAGSIGGSLAGSAAAGSVSPVCGPLAPACAVVLIGGSAYLSGHLSNSAMDRILPGPDPAQHDPDVVTDEVRGPAPGHLPRERSDATRDLINDVAEAGRAATPTHVLRRGELDPAAVAELDLPRSWVADTYGQDTLSAADWLARDEARANSDAAQAHRMAGYAAQDEARAAAHPADLQVEGTPPAAPAAPGDGTPPAGPPPSAGTLVETS
jgi:hypothetical protein